MKRTEARFEKNGTVLANLFCFLLLQSKASETFSPFNSLQLCKERRFSHRVLGRRTVLLDLLYFCRVVEEPGVYARLALDAHV